MKDFLPLIRFTLASFFIGLLAVSFFWLTYLFLDDQTLSAEGLRNIHENNVGLYILDALPFLVSFLGWYLQARSTRQIQSLKDEIETIREDIEEKAALAKKIGESDLMAQPEDFSEEDIPGKALTEMQRALAESRKKDAEAQWYRVTAFFVAYPCMHSKL
jgi:hypothetical protein